MAGALNHRSGLLPVDDIARDEKLAMDPPVSEAQRRWAFANAGKKGSEGKAATEFANADPGGKLPARAKDVFPNAPKVQKDGGPGSGPQGGHKFGLSAGHPSGAGPKFKTGANTHAEINTHIGNLRKSNPEHHVTVQNHHSGRVHTVKAGQAFNPNTVEDCDMTRDAMTNQEVEKWEKEKEEAHKMAPKGAANTTGTGRFGGRASEKAGSRDFTRKDEYNEAGT